MVLKIPIVALLVLIWYAVGRPSRTWARTPSAAAPTATAARAVAAAPAAPRAPRGAAPAAPPRMRTGAVARRRNVR